MIDKTDLLNALCEHLEADLRALIRRQEDTQKGATHAENRAEHAKDTRATEQSYLARGLAARAEEVRRTVAQLPKIDLVGFTDDDAIGLSAIVVLGDLENGENQIWWILPAPGGIELEQAGQRIRTLSPTAPLGRALLGLRVGDEGSFSTPRGIKTFEILEIA